MRALLPSKAFSRASLHQLSGVLAPFLYQTATLQQWIKPHVRRVTTNSSLIPFEIGDAIDTLPSTSLEDTASTITGQEKQIFNKLLDPTFDPKAVLHKKGRGRLTKSKAPSQKTRDHIGKDAQSRPLPRFKDPYLEKKHAELLASKEKAYRLARAQASKVLQAKFTEETDDLKRLREEHLADATAAFHKAKTDRELWKLLKKYAFEGIRMQLRDGQDIQQAVARTSKDPAKEATKRKSMLMKTPPESNLAVLIHTYNVLLVHFLHLLRQNFPASPLAFSLLPTIRSLGRQSYVLAASTSLYNALLEAHWHTFEFSRIDELLFEMENAGLEFEYETLDILERMRKQGDAVLKGRRGELVQRAWEMDRIGEGWRKVVGWIPKVKEALEADALRKASEIVETEEWTDADEERLRAV